MKITLRNHPRLLLLLLVIVALTRLCPAQSPTSNAKFPEVAELPVRKEMPEVLVMNDGRKVTTPEQWRQRREEMKAILEFYELGHCPPPPGNVTGRDLMSRPVLDGAAKFRLVHLQFGPGEKLGYDVAIFTPAKSDGPFPIIIHPSFFTRPESRTPRPRKPIPPLTPVQPRIRRQEPTRHRAGHFSAARWIRKPPRIILRIC